MQRRYKTIIILALLSIIGNPFAIYPSAIFDSSVIIYSDSLDTIACFKNTKQVHSLTTKDKHDSISYLVTCYARFDDTFKAREDIKKHEMAAVNIELFADSLLNNPIGFLKRATMFTFMTVTQEELGIVVHMAKANHSLSRKLIIKGILRRKQKTGAANP